MSSRRVGKRFVNQERTVHAAPRDLIRWIKTRERGFWPSWVEVRPQAPPSERVFGDSLVATFINHATVLLQFGGLNVLTDPVFSEAVGPLGRFGPRRHHAPGISLDRLPPIDVVLVSHDHYDHLDFPSVRRLARDHSPRFLVPLGNRARLERWGCARVDELDWWQTVEHEGHPFTFVPAQHFSGRSIHDRDTTLWGGFVVGGAHGPLFFAGDTGMGPHFREIRERFGPMRLALLPIGAYRPRWFMRRVHVDPIEAVEAHRILEAERSIGIHFGTFRLADEGRDDPVTDLRAACADQGVAEGDFVALEPGQGVTIPGRDTSRRLRGERV
jgi:L-ascorbate metabolism protein UlaG (beta-lactamase superfamily)